jgi:DNA-binding response OmpR family regulator
MNSTSDSAKHTILIIDDRPDDLKLMANCLEKADFKVMTAQNGESGLDTARRVQPDLILLDVLMPGIDGFETCRRLKAEASVQEIPVIFMTSLAETEHKITGFEVGGVDYITKPIQVAEVLARVKAHLAGRVLQKQLEAQNVQLQQEIAERKRAAQKEEEQEYGGKIYRLQQGI